MIVQIIFKTQIFGNIIVCTVYLIYLAIDNGLAYVAYSIYDLMVTLTWQFDKFGHDHQINVQKHQLQSHEYYSGRKEDEYKVLFTLELEIAVDIGHFPTNLPYLAE